LKALLQKTPLGAAFKRAYSNLMMQLQYCNHLAAPVLREMPKSHWEVPRYDSLGVPLSQLPSSWLEKLGAKCEEDSRVSVDSAVSRLVAKRPQFKVGSPDQEKVVDCVSLIHYIQNVASIHDLYLPSELNLALDMAKNKIRPKFAENAEAFQEVEKLVRDVVAFLSDPVENPK
jgi:hypothetical protein